MDPRAPPPLRGPAALRRPPHPQRAVSSGSLNALSYHLPKRPTLPSGLSNVRSASQPVRTADFVADELVNGGNVLAFGEETGRVVASPDVIPGDDDEAGPPAKRIKMDRDDFRAGTKDMHEEDIDPVDQIMPGEKLPELSKLGRGTKTGRSQRTYRSSIDPAARKTDGIEAPAIATRVPAPKKVLDFSPWLGNHQEDVLTEHVLKHGYSDSGKNTSSSECASAKAAIWPILSQKNGGGLQVLGYMFSAVMERRQAMGKSTAPSTFKPPPRVTVTDTKREAWLRDLANPEVPLRKQSRTIPHGIRGKLLMEQCLSKAIPLPRAVWLAKCVGANELRAFRRKGVSGSTAASGEAKWVREWTIHVEQFLDSVIGACGQHEWQQKMNYAVKLAASFFAEGLLDTEHYLDWIVSSLAGASLDRLPVWIIMGQLYWKHITAFGKRGKRFAEGVLEHLHNIARLNSGGYTALKTRLQKLVAVLAVSNRGCLIIPGVWDKYKDLLSPVTESDISAISPAKDIARRNERLAASLRSSAATISSPILDVYRELDQVGLQVDIETLATTCLALILDAARLVNACLEWSSTLYRTGDSRVYLAARLIAQLHRRGHDTDAVVLRHLSDLSHAPPATAHNQHMVVVSLVRLEAFSVGSYLKWLISSGLVVPNQETNLVAGLLTSIPAAGLAPHLVNSRKMLLRRLGVATDEQRLVEEFAAGLERSIADGDLDEGSFTLDIPEELSLSAKLDLAQMVSTKIGHAAKEGSFTLRIFSMLRSLVERIGDLASLERLLLAASSSDISALLASVCDTINLHAESFAALGSLESLVQTMTKQYTTLRSQQPLERVFVLALTGLVTRLPSQASLVKLLNDDLTICEQQTSLMVCSPASDSLIGMHATTLDSANDIDAVFASGNTMDEHLMLRVFQRIMELDAKPIPPTSQLFSRVCGWLNQLRLVDGTDALDRIVQNYVRALLKSGDDKGLPDFAFDSLVASSCLQYSTVVNAAAEVAAPTVASSVLSMLLSGGATNPALTEGEQYRLRLLRDRCIDDSSASLGILFRSAAESPDFDVENQDLLNFVIRRGSAKPGSVRCLFDTGRLTARVQATAGRLIAAVMQLDGHALQLSPRADMHPLIRMAGPLSARFCVEAVRWMRTNTHWTADDDDTFKDALLECFDRGSEVWPQLLEVANDKVKLAMHEWAQEQVLSMAGNERGGEDVLAEDHLQRFLKLLAVTSHAATKIDGTTFIDKIANKLRDVEGSLPEIHALETNRKEAHATLTQRLHLLLHLSVLHIHAVLSESDASKHARSSLLAALCSLLTHPLLQTHRPLLEYLSDLASTLADNILEDSHSAQRIPALAKLPSHPLLPFLLGSTAQNPTNLALTTHPPPPQPSQQQRALNRHPSSQLLQGSRPLASSPSMSSHARFPSQGTVVRGDGRVVGEVKTTPFVVRRWEVLPDPTPVMGENDGCLGLGLFGARRV